MIELPTNLAVNDENHLTIGGVDTIALVKKYGTPLFVYDVEGIRAKIRAFKQAFESNNVPYNIAYASKAFSCLAIYHVINEEGIAVDVVSGGELYTAIQADVPPQHIHFHGNNKQPAEIELALEYGIGCFIVDNEYEIELLNELATQQGTIATVQLRIAPGISAHTHEYITTGQRDSKFGFDLENGQAMKAIEKVLAQPALHLSGVHCHIGSQIFDPKAFAGAVEKLMQFLVAAKSTHQFVAQTLNVGGGFGIKYTDQDEPIENVVHIDAICQTTKRLCEELNYPLPEIWIEPGRTIVGDNAITLYTTGSQKEIPGLRNYVAIDGGMTDNIRPALYQAQYTGVLANKVTLPNEKSYAIAGKCCESGDMLVWDLLLPKVEVGDILALFATGAYGYAMANNYNRIPRPAVVFVEQGEEYLAIKRETYQDLIQLDCQ